MNTIPALLGIDLGTSSVKVVLLDASGRTIGLETAPYGLVSDRPGWAEAQPEAWWAATVSAARLLCSRVSVSVAGIGLSGQMHGVVVVDEGGRAVRNAITWADSRATYQLARWRELPAAELEALANPLSPGMAGPILAWLSEHEPESLRQARWAFSPKDYLRMRLTGIAGCEATDASATLLYDIAADDWSKAAVGAARIDPALLPPLVPSAGIVGGLLPQAAAEFGLPAGIPVVAGLADTAAAMLGTGLIGPGYVQLTIGSGGQVVSPVSSPSGRARNGVHTYRALEGWYRMGAILGAGLSLDWVRRTLDLDWAELYGAGAHLPDIGNPVFLPHLAGERTPYMDSTLRGGWLGLSFNNNREDLSRSALEGVAIALLSALEALEIEPRGGIWLAGGGTIDPGWRAMLADYLGYPLLAVDMPAASARGAALVAGLGIGWFTLSDLADKLAPERYLIAEPRPENAGIVAERIALWRASVAASDALSPGD